jgi:WD40 repeat protein
MTGKLLLTSRGHAAEELVVSWSPDGQQIASVIAGCLVQLWNATTGQQGWRLHL